MVTIVAAFTWDTPSLSPCAFVIICASVFTFSPLSYHLFAIIISPLPPFQFVPFLRSPVTVKLSFSYVLLSFFFYICHTYYVYPWYHLFSIQPFPYNHLRYHVCLRYHMGLVIPCDSFIAFIVTWLFVIICASLTMCVPMLPPFLMWQFTSWFRSLDKCVARSFNSTWKCWFSAMSCGGARWVLLLSSLTDFFFINQNNWKMLFYHEMKLRSHNKPWGYNHSSQ